MNNKVFCDVKSRVGILSITAAVVLVLLSVWGARNIWANSFALACISLLSGGVPALVIYWFATYREKKLYEYEAAKALCLLVFDVSYNKNILEKFCSSQYRVSKQASSYVVIDNFSANSVVIKKLDDDKLLFITGMNKSFDKLPASFDSEDLKLMYTLYSRTSEVISNPLLANIYASDLMEKSEKVLKMLSDKYGVRI